ncbi:hypothetical protein SAMN05216553_12070 [Lentzea fradiae]|uniref:Uncharacterized protein n=1 Tax=Lentzea fradiae TaxID=200378 RepID=A0A1G8BV08_9PSEU|nr:hypothetical protein [Lentzea fradiae]SDH37045.1 hypothetical protein SAMN05216553_12070 [Lentzea fradiae]
MTDRSSVVISVSLVSHLGEELEEQAGRLLDEFGDWAAGRGIEVDLFVAEAALDARVTGDGVLTRWDAADVESVLLEWFPRKVTLERSEWPLVLVTLHGWVDFLAATRAAGTGDVAGLHAVIDRSASEFQARMGEERNFGLSKFWMVRMVEHGVDIADGEDVRAFLMAAQAGEVDYDRDVLDEIMRRHALGSDADLVLPEFVEDSPGPLPPTLVPSDDEVAALAEGTDVVARFRVLVSWVGAGRVLTTTKRLRVADARELALLLEVDTPYLELARSSADLPQVSLLVAWARAARLVRVVKGRLVPVKSAARVPARPLDLWWRVFEAFDDLGPAACGPASRFEEPSLVGQVLPEVMLDLWLSLYTAGGTPVPVELLAAGVRETVSAGYGLGALLGGFREVMWRRDLGAVLAALAALGAVELTTAAEVWERDKIVELSGRDDPDFTLVRLTPLGLWGVRKALRAQGIDAPSVEELAEAPLEQVCEAVESCAPEIADSVLATWVARRDAAQAATELAAFCVNGPTPVVRLLAWNALEHTGTPGVVEARRLRSEGGVVGGVAARWLAGRGELAPEAVGEREMMLALSEEMAAMHDHGVLLEEMTTHPLRDQLGFVRAVAVTDHPDRNPMLATIARDHPEHEIVTAANEALGSSAR